MPAGVTIRQVHDEDIPAITRIYAHYVLQTTISFELDPPEEAEIDQRRKGVERVGLPYLVAELDERVAGYAYATPYRPRKAYRFTVEDSIYLDPAFTGRGIGRLLLQEIIDSCTDLGYRQMIAVIGGSDNVPSIRLHQRLGFLPAGVLPSAGFKLGQWADSVLMQRPLGMGGTTLPDPSLFLSL